MASVILEILLMKPSGPQIKTNCSPFSSIHLCFVFIQPADASFVQLSSVCIFSLNIGQRRLWEAVKRRKAMCKRKSWMSKVSHTHTHTRFSTSILDRCYIQSQLWLRVPF